MSSPSPAPSSLARPTNATPVIAGTLSGCILLAVCIVTALLLRKRRDRLRSERAFRMAGFLRSDVRAQATPTALSPDPAKPAASRHHHPQPLDRSSPPLSPPSPSHPRPASSPRTRVYIPLTNRADSRINGGEIHNNSIREGRTSNSDVILALADADARRSDGDRAGALIPSIVVSEGAPNYTLDQPSARTLPPHSNDARLSSRRPNALTIPPPATQSPTRPSPTLLHPTSDSSSAVSLSSTSFPCPSLSSPSSSPTLPSSASFTTSSRHFSSNNERNFWAMHDDSNANTALTTPLLREPVAEGVLNGPSLRRHDPEAPPPAYEKCVTGARRLENV